MADRETLLRDLDVLAAAAGALADWVDHLAGPSLDPRAAERTRHGVAGPAESLRGHVTASTAEEIRAACRDLLARSDTLFEAGEPHDRAAQDRAISVTWYARDIAGRRMRLADACFDSP